LLILKPFCPHHLAAHSGTFFFETAPLQAGSTKDLSGKIEYSSSHNPLRNDYLNFLIYLFVGLNVAKTEAQSNH